MLEQVSRRSMLDAAGDMLTAALDTVLSYGGPGMRKEPVDQPVNLTPDKEINTFSTAVRTEHCITC